MTKGFRTLFICIILAIPGVESSGDGEEVIYPKENIESTLIQGGSKSNSNYYLERIFIVTLLGITGVGGVCFYLWRKGKFSLNPRSNDNRLKLCETKMLGNKQFLVVVEYETQKMLLGVGPGTISHLCYLGSQRVDEELYSKV